MVSPQQPSLARDAQLARRSKGARAVQTRPDAAVTNITTFRGIQTVVQSWLTSIALAMASK